MKKTFPLTLIFTTLVCFILLACVTRHTRKTEESIDSVAGAVIQIEAPEFPSELEAKWRYPGSKIKGSMILHSDTLKTSIVMLETPDSVKSVEHYYKSLDGDYWSLESTMESTDEEGHFDSMLSFSGENLGVLVTISEEDEYRSITIIFSKSIPE